MTRPQSLTEIASARMLNQRLAGPAAVTPAEVVRHFGAVQAQDYYGSLWAIGQRCATPTKAAVDAAIADRTIVRSWPMRGTLHFVAAEDLRWMVKLLAPRIVTLHGKRLQRDLELDAAAMRQARRAIVPALEGGNALTRSALYRILENAGIHAGDSRGIHILWWLAHEGVICFGARQGSQPTFALLDDWIPSSRDLEGDEALAEIARRYFAAHGPAAVKDFIWWTGLAAADARRAVELIAPELESFSVENTIYHCGGGVPSVNVDRKQIYLLPAYDEITVGYTDRKPVIGKLKLGRGSVIFSPVIVRDAQVVGTWKSKAIGNRTGVTVEPFAVASKLNQRELGAALHRYSEFLGQPVTI